MRDGNSSCQVAIIGAGPYGLAAAAHLRAQRLEIRVLGEPMEFWKQHMPRGMLLRSSAAASSLGDPDGQLRLDSYRALHRLPKAKPVPIEDFVRYGLWFQARRVVVATGLGPFAQRPAQFDGLPASLVSHTFDHSDLSRFAGQRVVVLGAGQSALESAALLHEAGAETEVVARASRINALPGSTDQAAFVRAARRLLSPIARPPLDIMGPRFVSWLIAWPRMFRRSPRALQDFLTARAVRPAGASWLFPRLASVRITTGCTIAGATPTGSQLRVRLGDGSERVVDHLLLATGYRVDIGRYPFLSSTLRQAVRTRDGYPDLDVGFESSVPGLHFTGAPAANTFGPLCRFVVGTRYAAHALTRYITSRANNGHSRHSLMLNAARGA